MKNSQNFILKKNTLALFIGAAIVSFSGISSAQHKFDNSFNDLSNENSYNTEFSQKNYTSIYDMDEASAKSAINSLQQQTAKDIETLHTTRSAVKNNKTDKTSLSETEYKAREQERLAIARALDKRHANAEDVLKNLPRLSTIYSIKQEQKKNLAEKSLQTATVNEQLSQSRPQPSSTGKITDRLAAFSAKKKQQQ